MLAVTGYKTTINQRLMKLLPSEEFVRFGELTDYSSCERYMFAAGLMHSKGILDQTYAQIYESMRVNLIDVMRHCERVLELNKTARICVIGSESAILGSYDQIYAVAKAGLHAYVRTRRVLPTQSLACVAPPIIADSGMTSRRHDYPEVLEKRRTVKAAQVAALVVETLYSPVLLGRTVVELMP